MRPRSATSLPVSTASTGLLCLLVGAHVHRGKSDTEVSMWPWPCTFRVCCVTYIVVLLLALQFQHVGKHFPLSLLTPYLLSLL